MKNHSPPSPSQQFAISVFDETMLDDGQLSPVPVHESVLFLARFLGTSVQLERLNDTLAGKDSSRAGDIPPDLLRRLLANAGLVGTVLSVNKPRKATELPALVVGDGGLTVAVVGMKDGRLFECQLPGIAGTTWLDADTLAQEAPNGRWYAVRPRLFFDQRSLLYALPEPARWFWGVFRRNQWIFHWALAGTFALNIFGALVPFYSMAVYDRVIPNNALGSLAVLTTGVLLLIVFEFVMKLMRSHLLETAARRIDVALSARVFAQCLKLRAAARPASGGVLANTVRDFESVRDFFATTTLTVLGDVPFMLLYVAIIFMIGGPLGWVSVACIPLLLAISFLARGPLSRKVNESMRESSQRTAHLFETMNGLDTVKAIGAEAWSRRKWEGLTQVIAQNNLETRELMAKINYGNAAVMGLSTVAVVAAGSVMVAEHAITLGQIIGVSLLTGRALAPVAQIASLIVRWEQTKMSYQALDKIMNSPTDESPTALQAPPLTGQVEFRDVSFSYPNQPPVVERISLRIRPGERVGVIGKLGSGKSTLLKLILNQYEPSTGSVLLDNLVNTQLEPLSMRRQIGYVPQDVTLFHGTLRENIELGRVRTDDARLLEAARLAGLDEIVAQLPEGVGTQVGERGERLSGGQRQSVAIARALLNKPRLLLLDEPSSMVDPASEQKLIERLRSLQKTTILLVTHRMAMLALVDRLVVMDRGRIVADGPRDQVLQALSAQRQSEDAAAAARAATARAAAEAASANAQAKGPQADKVVLDAAATHLHAQVPPQAARAPANAPANAPAAAPASAPSQAAKAAARPASAAPTSAAGTTGASLGGSFSFAPKPAASPRQAPGDGSRRDGSTVAGDL